jgi:hypothetical protein
VLPCLVYLIFDSDFLRKNIQPKCTSENCVATCIMVISSAKLPISTLLRVSDIVSSQLPRRELIGHGRHPMGKNL